VFADMNVATGGVLEPGDHAHGRGLAAAGRAEKHQKLAVCHVEVEVFDPDEIAPALAHIFQGDRSHVQQSQPVAKNSIGLH